MGYYTGINTTKGGATSFVDGLLKMVVQMSLHQMGLKEQEKERETALSQQKEMADYQAQLQAQRDTKYFERQQTLSRQQFNQRQVLEGQKAATSRVTSYLKSLDKEIGASKPGQKGMTEGEALTDMRKFPWFKNLTDEAVAGISILMQNGMSAVQARAFLEDQGGRIFKSFENMAFPERQAANRKLIESMVGTYISDQEASEIMANENHVWWAIAEEMNKVASEGKYEAPAVTERRVLRNIQTAKVEQIAGPDAKITGENLQAALQKLIGKEIEIPPGKYGPEEIGDFLADEGVIDDLRIMNVLQEALEPGSVKKKAPLLSLERIEPAIAGAGKAALGVAGQTAKDLFSTTPPGPREYRNILTEPLYVMQERQAQQLAAMKEVWGGSAKQIWDWLEKERKRQAQAYSDAKRKK